MEKGKDIKSGEIRSTMKRASHCFLLFVVCFLFLASCSNDKNTAQSRWWHSFNAKYNTYFNGSQAYIDASLEKENGHRDNFTEMIPLYPVSNKNSKEIGKGNFNKAIEARNDSLTDEENPELKDSLFFIPLTGGICRLALHIAQNPQ